MALPTGPGPSWADLVAALVSTRTDHATARFDEVLAAAEKTAKTNMQGTVSGAQESASALASSSRWC